MAEKRRDAKGRVLRNGESQRADGRYRFKYVDGNGVAHDVYSWRLVAADRLPAGKRDCKPLRELEEQILRDISDGVAVRGDGLTVYKLCERYIATKVNTTRNTQANYKTVMKILEKDPFGARRIDTVKQLDAQEFLIHLQRDLNKGYSSACNIRGVLRPAFKMAVQNELIRLNPFNFEVQEVLINDSVRRESITPDQQRKFLKFIKEDDHFKMYYEPIALLFYTGLRISELCALTVEDIDLKEKKFTVCRQLQRDRNGQLYIVDINLKESTKTTSGVRVLPMTQTVYNLFETVLENRNETEEPVVDGYTHFLFINHNVRKDIRPYVAMDWEHIFKHILDKHNSIYKEELPKITPHVCRHTYATQMAKKLGIKSLQYVLGHSSVSTTLDIYTDYRFEDARKDMENIQDDEW